ncbi:MAG: PQQ-like beta-propeller repeat protein [Holophagales bacterium]|nr:PQQ-like beta-propeller repeat protein [Holophagales bacterium]
MHRPSNRALPPRLPSLLGMSALAGLLLFTALPSFGEPIGSDWPQFRGPHRDGIARETGLLDSWPNGGPPELWRVPLGEGYSGITVVEDRLYTMYAAEVPAGEGEENKAREFAAAFDAATGKELWRTDVGEKLDTEFGNGPRSTPAVDGDTVYVLSSHGRFAALDTKDGSVRWKLELTEDFGSERPYWGYSTSVLVDGDRLILEAGGKEGKTLVALDKKDGKTLWARGDAGPGYNSPLPVEMNGERRYVYVSGGKLYCIDAEGEELWAHDWPRGETHAMPIALGPGLIYASGAEGVGAQVVKVDPEDETKVEQVWSSHKIRNHFSTSVVHDGVIYGFDNATLKAVKGEDGSLVWAKRGLGKGSLILADGHLVVLSDRGKLLLLEAGTDKYTEKGMVQALNDLSWTAPTVSHGRLYLRNHQELVSFDVRAKGGA